MTATTLRNVLDDIATYGLRITDASALPFQVVQGDDRLCRAITRAHQDGTMSRLQDTQKIVSEIARRICPNEIVVLTLTDPYRQTGHLTLSWPFSVDGLRWSADLALLELIDRN
jgi:hypothetical protein